MHTDYFQRVSMKSIISVESVTAMHIVSLLRTRDEALMMSKSWRKGYVLSLGRSSWRVIRSKDFIDTWTSEHEIR